jgi:hypothetical protein
VARDYSEEVARLHDGTTGRGLRRRAVARRWSGGSERGCSAVVARGATAAPDEKAGRAAVAR